MKKPRLADVNAALTAALVALVSILAVDYVLPGARLGSNGVVVLAVVFTGCGVLVSRLRG